MEDLIIRAGVVRSLAPNAGKQSQRRQRGRLVDIFNACASDAERCLLLDMTANESAHQCFLFVDDGRFRSSCTPAVGLTADALTEYAATAGVVYPTGAKEKCVVVPDAVNYVTADDISHAVDGRLQGGTPRVRTVAKNLGMPIGSNDKVPPARKQQPGADADLVLREVERQGSIAVRTVVARSKVDAWPLVARRFYFRRAFCRVAYLSPLTIAARTAGKRMTNMQVRWAMAVMQGTTPRASG